MACFYFIFPNGRVHQLEEENGEMAISTNRLKSQTEKLDEVRYFYYTVTDFSFFFEEKMEEIDHFDLR